MSLGEARDICNAGGTASDAANSAEQDCEAPGHVEERLRVDEICSAFVQALIYDLLNNIL